MKKQIEFPFLISQHKENTKSIPYANLEIRAKVEESIELYSYRVVFAQCTTDLFQEMRESAENDLTTRTRACQTMLSQDQCRVDNHRVKEV